VPQTWQEPLLALACEQELGGCGVTWGVITFCGQKEWGVPSFKVRLGLTVVGCLLGLLRQESQQMPPLHVVCWVCRRACRLRAVVAVGRSCPEPVSRPPVLRKRDNTATCELAAASEAAAPLYLLLTCSCSVAPAV
jgi:hypothetical protein